MTKQEAETLITAIRSLVEGPSKAREVVAQSPDGAKLVKPSTEPAFAPVPPGNGVDLEKLYLAFKERMLNDLRDDPIMLQLVMQRPEIIVEIAPRVLKVDGSTLTGRVARLVAAGYFDDPKAPGAVRKELTRTGTDPGGGGALYDCLKALKRDGFLVEAGPGYAKSPACRITEKELVAV